MLKRVLFATAAICAAAPASAFGLKSHLWIADQVYQDLTDCRLTIREEEFAVPPKRCSDILANRKEFMTGALGPDAFPDLVVGQSIVHPGVKDGQQADFWLERLLTKASLPEEVAFSWGYAMHYAGDIFAHTYVNNYAGNVFDILKGGTPGVELRHFRLEKYLDQFLDYEFDTKLLAVPAPFLARELVRYPYHQLGQRTTGHMSVMLTALKLAKYARDKRAPKLLKSSRAAMDLRLKKLAALETEYGIPASEGRPFDRRAYRDVLSKGKIERLRKAHSAYESAADLWRRDVALVEFAKMWAADVEAIGELYIGASLDFAVNMINQGGTDPRPYHERASMLEPYRRWGGCYAQVLRGQPLEVGHAACGRRDKMNATIDFMEAAVRSAGGWKVRSVYLTMLQVERYVLEAMGRSLLKVVSIGDKNVGRLVREIADPARIDHVALNKAFDRSYKGELAFTCVADWIDFDLKLRDSAPRGDLGCDKVPLRATMNPRDFKPLEYALVLAKLSLLDQSGLKELALRFGGDPAEMRLTDSPQYSVLLDTVKSLDGNHQWSAKSMPFPRANPYRKPFKYLSAGFGLRRDRKRGFPLYQSEGLRKGPFTKLFPEPFEGAILSRPEMKPTHYPFRPCAGDPLRPHASAAEVVVCNDD